ncbi:NAD/NADP octopine/nopaline dehydrogenase family protein [Sporosarcina luteola]|uniref:NAD/NADP octopine/nopaline dehydrogenase family protein n=1 Tax=Sporosarcina luteola TaxID=582850 RepID=UPI00203EE439|nr:NAD/NADP octopine/nopaline dehydrogenase family protein [Sporosarcina luteola]MCM3743530.1 NAD/NADP octopine/nopaline dehydrogenase family protein [Sporosarcina luteola]
MSYAVIGGGNTGQAIAGYLTLKEESVKLYTRDSSKAQRISTNGLEVKGVYSGKAMLEASTSMDEVISDAEFIIISTTAMGHEPIISQIKPLLKNNQTIIFFPGYWGATECKRILGRDLIKNKNITVAETSAMPFVSIADNAGSVYINKIKHNVLISTLCKENPIATSFMNRFPQLILGNSVFETSLNNSNAVIHPPITLFNAARIDASETFQFYTDGASPYSVNYVEKLDIERLQIASQLKVDTQSILTVLNEFYETNYPTLYEALPGLFPTGNAPTTLDYRYMTEDIPFGLVPISELGKILGVETPYTDSIISTASLLMDSDYRKDGINFNGLTKENLLDMSAVNKVEL